MSNPSQEAKRIIVIPGKRTVYLSALTPKETSLTDARDKAMQLTASESVYALEHVHAYGYPEAYVAYL